MTRLELRTMFLGDVIDEPEAAPWDGDMVAVDRLIEQTYYSLIDSIIVRNRWYYIKEDTVTVLSGAKTIVMPTDFCILEQITDTVTNKALRHLAPQKEYAITAVGRPSMFWEYDRSTFNLFPIPDVSYSYLVKYRYRPTWPTTEAGTVIFPPGRELVIALKAAIIAAAKLREGSDEIGNRKVLFSDELELLLRSIEFNPQNVSRSARRGM